MITQQSDSLGCAVHLRMKSQGLRELFFRIAEALLGARGRVQAAQRSHSARRAVHLVCTSFFVVPGGALWRRRPRRPAGSRRAVRGGMILWWCG